MLKKYVYSWYFVIDFFSAFPYEYFFKEVMLAKSIVLVKTVKLGKLTRLLRL